MPFFAAISTNGGKIFVIIVKYSLAGILHDVKVKFVAVHNEIFRTEYFGKIKAFRKQVLVIFGIAVSAVAIKRSVALIYVQSGFIKDPECLVYRLLCRVGAGSIIEKLNSGIAQRGSSLFDCGGFFCNSVNSLRFPYIIPH